jgi:sugar lactone lactonase YvrE
MKKKSLIAISILATLRLGLTPLSAQPPTITSQPASRAVWAGGNATFAVTVAGEGPFTYQWQWNGTNLPNGIITTVAGGGAAENVPATNAQLSLTSGLAIGRSGDLFIADGYRIRRVSTNGIMTIFAGNGSAGYSGDAGPAIEAELALPSAIAQDAFGNVIIADTGNHRIRKVDLEGIISTVAGQGANTPGTNPSHDIGTFSGDGGAATNAGLSDPQGIAVDTADDLLIADKQNNRIRKVDANGIITTMAGNGTNGFSGDGGPATNAALNWPTAVAFDAVGDLLICDTGNSLIRKVDANGIITTMAGDGTNGFSGDGGPATNAALNWPTAVAFDAVGDLLICDLGNSRVRKVDANGIITTVAGGGTNVLGDGGPATNASLAPSGLAVASSGDLLISDNGNNRIRKVNTDGIITTIAGGGPAYLGDGGAAANSGINPFCMTVDSVGNLFVSDGPTAPFFTPQSPPIGDRIRKIDTNGIIATVAGNGAFGVSGQNPGGQGDGGPATDATLLNTAGLAIDAAGELFIAGGSGWDSFGGGWENDGDGRVRKVGTNGIISTTLADFGVPDGLAVDASGNLFIGDWFRILKLNTSGILTTVAGGGTNYPGGGGLATLASLHGGDQSAIALDAAGNLYITDNFYETVFKVDSNGIITTIDTGSSHYYPTAIATDAAGNLFVATQSDLYYNNTFTYVLRVGVDGVITTVAGGYAGYSGDGGAATNAQLSGIGGIAVDPFGNLFIADTLNYRVRKITNTQGPILSLSDVRLGDSGNYQVVVTGPAGSVTSSVAILTVASLPRISGAVRQSDSAVTITLLSSPNSTNVLFSATNLTPPVSWVPISTNTAAGDGTWQYTDTNTADYPARFFRLHLN